MILIGYILRLKNKIKLIDIYVLLIFIACVFFTSNGPRYLTPIFPFLIFYFLYPMQRLRKVRRKLIGLTFLIILIPSLIADFHYINKARNDPYKADEKGYLESLKWIKHHSLPHERIMCRKPKIAFLFTDLRAAYYPATEDAKKSMEMIKKNEIDYIVLDNLGKKDKKFGIWLAKRFFDTVIEKYPDNFLQVYSSKKSAGNIVYRVIK